jgi:hypothetical protein
LDYIHPEREGATRTYPEAAFAPHSPKSLIFARAMIERALDRLVAGG